MSDSEKKSPAEQPPQVEIITDEARVDERPLVTIRTPETEGKRFFFKIHQPQGRALLIALHL